MRDYIDTTDGYIITVDLYCDHPEDSGKTYTFAFVQPYWGDLPDYPAICKELVEKVDRYHYWHEYTFLFQFACNHKLVGKVYKGDGYEFHLTQVNR